MTLDENNSPTTTDEPTDTVSDVTVPDDDTTVEPVEVQNGTPEKTANEAPAMGDPVEARMNERLERLGGEPAPVITPEEFARLQKAGQVHIDSRGRVRTERPRGVDPGVSLRKRRAWYGAPNRN